MALSIVSTTDERIVSDAAFSALKAAVEREGAATLIVGSAAESLCARRSLADRGLGLGVKVSTFAEWVGEMWGLWGDGRTIADACALTMVAYELIGEEPETAGPIEALPGNVGVLARLVSTSAPWLPIRGGKADEDAIRMAGLPRGEACFVRLAAHLAKRLEELGYLSASAASVALIERLRVSQVKVSPLVIAGISRMQRQERELCGSLASMTDVVFVATKPTGPAARQVANLVRELGLGELPDACCEKPSMPWRDRSLQSVDDALFGDEVAPYASDAPVEMLLASGPVAEPELIAERISKLVAQDPAQRIVVAVPDVRRSWMELAPKLEARHISARVRLSVPAAQSDAAVAFLTFAKAVADLDRRSREWPEPRMGVECEVNVLGPMDWWPPSPIVDFLFKDMAQMDAAKVWQLDKLWRSNRLLTPAQVLEMLQKVRYTSEAVASATRELLRGRIGTAASRLIAPYGKTRGRRLGASSGESEAVLDAVLKISRTLRSLGIYYNPRSEDTRSLTEVLDLFGMALEGRSISARLGVGPDHSRAVVEIMGIRDATCLDGGSADTLIIGGLTSSEQPVEGKKGVFEAMLEELGVEPERDSLSEARANFRRLIGVASRRLLLERCLNDADGKQTYPSAMLSELMEALGSSATEKPENLTIDHRLRSERTLSENLSADGSVRRPVTVDNPAPAGQLTDEARPYVFVPPTRRDPLPEDLPILSASQIETYLECPYKWFSLRRMRLGNVDAGFSPLEMGVSAHRVLEITHTKLLLDALAKEEGTRLESLDERECAELLAGLARDPVRHIEGSAVTDENLAFAQELLERAFTLHMEHMHSPSAAKSGQPLLIAHNSADRAAEERMKKDLLSCLSYQRKILNGFEPRFFEWEFGRGDEPVKYAGAYFTGTVDRIDVSPHGSAVIIDYKYKSTAGFNGEYDALQDGVREGVRLPARVQSLIYAQVVRRAFEGRLKLVGSVYLSCQEPHALAGVTTENVCDNVFGRSLGKRGERVCVSEGDGSSMDDLLDQTEELIAEQVKMMLAGNVEARPRDMKSCDFCPVMQCEKRRAH